MKQFLLFLTIFFFTLNAFSQSKPELEASNEVISKDHNNGQSRSTKNTENRCTDTIGYTQEKASNYRGIYLNASSSAQALGQYYEIPQDVTIHGFEFFANQESSNPPGTIDIICNLYKASGTKMPSGQPIRSIAVPVKYVSSGSLINLRYSAIFAEPITVDFPVVLTIETNSNLNVTGYTSNWDNQDGDGEFLASGKIGGVWYPSDLITVGGNTFDADVVLQPYVSYNAGADFELSKHCIDAGDTIEITNTSSGIFDSRFFNKIVYNDPNQSGEGSFKWTFSHDTTPYIGYDTFFITQNKDEHVVIMEASIDKWESGSCRIIVQDSVDEVPVADFEKSGFSGAMKFLNKSKGNDKSTWYFSDSIYTNLTNPSYYFLSTGDHEVTLIITNGCGSDTVTKTITVHAVGLEGSLLEEIEVYPIPTSDYLKVRIPAQNGETTLRLYNSLGQVILQEEVYSEVNNLDVSNIEAGNYFLVIRSGEAVRTFKVIVQVR